MATYIVSPSDFIGRRVRSDVTPGVSFVVKVTISMVNVTATSIMISIVISISIIIITMIIIIISLEIDIVSLLKISGVDCRPETELQLRRNYEVFLSYFFISFIVISNHLNNKNGLHVFISST